MTGRNPVQQINESLRNAMAFSDALPVSPVVPSAVPASVQKSIPYRTLEFFSHRLNIVIGRRVAATSSAPSIKLPSPAPPTVQTPAQRSRLAHQTHRPSPARSRRVVSPVGADEDAEGEDDMEDVGDDGEDNEDKSLYCFCQKMSYGEVSAALSFRRIWVAQCELRRWLHATTQIVLTNG